jgi:hypothetical protein
MQKEKKKYKKSKEIHEEENWENSIEYSMKENKVQGNSVSISK